MKLADIFDIAEDARRLGRPYDDVLALAGDAAAWFDVLRPREHAPLRMQSMWAKLGVGEPVAYWETQESALIRDLTATTAPTWSSAVRFGQEAALPSTALPDIATESVMLTVNVDGSISYSAEGYQRMGEAIASAVAATLSAGT